MRGALRSGETPGDPRSVDSRQGARGGPRPYRPSTASRPRPCARPAAGHAAPVMTDRLLDGAFWTPGPECRALARRTISLSCGPMSLRTIPLLVALAHLGVVAVPCFEMGTAPPGPVALAASHARHGHPVRHGQHPPHAQELQHAAHAHRVQHAPHAPHAPHGDDAHPGHPGDTANEHQAPSYAMRAPCPCGCSSEGASPATSGSRTGFALFPPKAEPLPASAPPFLLVTQDRMPDPPLRLPDHVPVLA